MPSQEEIKTALQAESRNLENMESRKEVSMPQSSSIDNQPDIDERALSHYLLEITRNDEMDKVNSGWTSKRRQDIELYYMIKDEALSHYPYPNAANFPEPITPVLLDTGTAAINEAMFYNPAKTISVRGLGTEDKRIAKHRQKLLNSQIEGHLDIYNVMDWNTFQTLLHGNSFIENFKDINSYFGTKLKVDMIEDVYMPINASGVQRDKTDHVSVAIGLSIQDLIGLMQLKDERGRNVFKNLDQIMPGWTIGNASQKKDIEEMRDIAYSTDYIKKMGRDIFFLMTTYMTWYHSAGARPIELKVWWIPSTGAISRYEIVKEKYRPISKFGIYKNHGRAFDMSLPEKIAHIQREATYTIKQVIDAGDISMMPSIFVDAGNDFDAEKYRRVPAGVYPKSPNSTVQFEQMNVAPILAREQLVERYWRLAENVSGFTNLFQGIEPDRRLTATSDVLRAKKGQMRFSKILRNYNEGWSDLVRNIDYQNELYMPRKIAIAILGDTELQTIDELYPKDKLGIENGMVKSGNLDFSMAVRPIDEIEAEKEKQSQFWSQVALSAFGQDPKVLWKCLDKIGLSGYNVDDFADVVPKPDGVDTLSPEQVINNIMSGAEDVKPDPSVPPEPYMAAIRKFMLTLSYKEADPKKKAIFNRFMVACELLASIQKLAMYDANNISANGILQNLMAGMAQQNGAGQNGQQNGGIPPIPANVPNV